MARTNYIGYIRPEKRIIEPRMVQLRFSCIPVGDFLLALCGGREQHDSLRATGETLPDVPATLRVRHAGHTCTSSHFRKVGLIRVEHKSRN